MSMVDDPRPPLPDWVTDAYTVTETSITETAGDSSQSVAPAINRDQAVDVLCADEDLALEPDDAEYALTRLLNRGYFYAVDGELRITTPPGED
ncbi:hypothetical protein Htur_4508 (plasmid) [Haloterrigena turkmenica DSM 5511]|uniref:Uncharacterized protein n=1 Tax=Haloterrigena turkmenica (strain ATCC 51198 / DSM 5511 / JCM 9101 / NCIMB 13204 / VKM B-1734 / 4k) TaxID=543526 RepID=D2S1S1_HALTV|nr:hypothetical protein [Haloterrigena turkmenica]ADB63318.1 hypothetical protein Htur_4508 [Haloterrigena turkmenica DSM 5511]